jgi:hypothetical protein
LEASVSRRKDGRVWQPLQRATRVIDPQVYELARTDEKVAAALQEARGDEIWRNDKYVVSVRRDAATGHVVRLSVRRDDRRPVRDWRDLQRIKNELAGPETEAVEIYPAESRLVDVANQTWLWVLPPGMTIPLGFPGRAVAGPDKAARYGAVQREPAP